jgi:excisionase family DNA binding protein
MYPRPQQIGLEHADKKKGGDVMNHDDPVTPLAYTVPQAAKVLGLSAISVYNLVKADKIPYLRISRKILIPVEPLKAFVNSLGEDLGNNGKKVK